MSLIYVNQNIDFPILLGFNDVNFKPKVSLDGKVFLYIHLDYLIGKLDTEYIPFIRHFHFLVNMLRESGVNLDEKTKVRLNKLLVAYIKIQDSMPRDKGTDNRWYDLINIVMEEYPYGENIADLLSTNQ